MLNIVFSFSFFYEVYVAMEYSSDGLVLSSIWDTGFLKLVSKMYTNTGSTVYMYMVHSSHLLYKRT